MDLTQRDYNLVPLPEGPRAIQHQAQRLSDGAGAATPARRPAPSASGDEEESDLITPGVDDHRAPLPIQDVLTSPNGDRA
jgi:hypothetical protein